MQVNGSGKSAPQELGANENNGVEQGTGGRARRFSRQRAGVELPDNEAYTLAFFQRDIAIVGFVDNAGFIVSQTKKSLSKSLEDLKKEMKSNVLLKDNVAALNCIREQFKAIGTFHDMLTRFFQSEEMAAIKGISHGLSAMFPMLQKLHAVPFAHIQLLISYGDALASENRARESSEIKCLITFVRACYSQVSAVVIQGDQVGMKLNSGLKGDDVAMAADAFISQLSTLGQSTG